MPLADGLLNVIKPYSTLVIRQKAAELKKQGIDIISLGGAEPDFNSLDNIKNAAINNIRLGYTNVYGIIELKEAVQAKLKKENNLDCELNKIIISAGGKQVIYNLFVASLNKGDEVIIPSVIS